MYSRIEKGQTELPRSTDCGVDQREKGFICSEGSKRLDEDEHEVLNFSQKKKAKALKNRHGAAIKWVNGS